MFLNDFMFILIHYQRESFSIWIFNLKLSSVIRLAEEIHHDDESRLFMMMFLNDFIISLNHYQGESFSIWVFNLVHSSVKRLAEEFSSWWWSSGFTSSRWWWNHSKVHHDDGFSWWWVIFNLNFQLESVISHPVNRSHHHDESRLFMMMVSHDDEIIQKFIMMMVSHDESVSIWIFNLKPSSVSLLSESKENLPDDDFTGQARKVRWLLERAGNRRRCWKDLQGWKKNYIGLQTYSIIGLMQ